MTSPRPSPWAVPSGIAILCAALVAGAAAAPAEVDRDITRTGPDAGADTGARVDRAMPASGIQRFDGRPGAPRATLRAWRQLYHELRTAADDPTARPETERLLARGRRRHDAIPIALVFDRYRRLPADAAQRTGAEPPAGIELPLETHTAFAAAPLRDWTHRGSDVALVLERGTFFSNAGVPLSRLEIDLDDGLGSRALALDVPVRARYAETGTKSVRLRARAGNESLEASFALVVRALASPSPDDTMHVTGVIPYLGGVAAGDAYVYLTPGRTQITSPVVVVEGFDLDNSMNWDELYALLNQEQLIETLRADGYDAVVLNFADATDYIQRNAFVLVELLQQVRAIVGPQTTLALAGASMGGLVGRYALAYMESHALDHSVRTFVSFDAPHRGADIPLGIQYWVKFFSGLSADAAELLATLDRPAARQMLVYHYTDPPGSTGQADPLRATFLSDLAANGGFPTLPRTVAVANGSKAAAGQGFAPAAQIIQYDYSSPLVAVRGNVWAVPSAVSDTIFDGRIRILISTTQQTVLVSGTLPYDNAPGGWRATMTQMDTTAAPYGDIVALHPSHCFIPTVSALDIDAPDLFHDIQADPDPLALTPFDAIYAPLVNQEHVAITPENAVWLRGEIEQGITAVAPGRASPTIELARPSPNPSSGTVAITFTLPRAGEVDLRVLGVDGRQAARLADGRRWNAGTHQVAWPGTQGGRPAAAGVYFVRLGFEDQTVTRRLVRLPASGSR